MTKLFLFVLLWCLDSLSKVNGAVRTGDSSQWPENNIKLSPSGSLSELFAAGLRPYRFPRMENSQLEFKHSRIKFIQADSVALPSFATEWADVTVLDGGLLSSIVLKQFPMTLPACRAEMLRWIPFGTRPVRTSNDLDEFLKAVAKDYRGYNYGPQAIDHDFRLVWKDSKGLSYAVWLQQARLPETPLLVQMQVGWERPEIQERSLYNIPIPPPPGYENVDMTAPKDFGPDSPPEDPEVERVRKAGVMPDYSMLPKEKIRSGVLPPGHTAMPPLPPQRAAPIEPPVAKPAAEQPTAPSTAWLWLVGGLALAVLIFIANTLRKRRR